MRSASRIFSGRSENPTALFICGDLRYTGVEFDGREGDLRQKANSIFTRFLEERLPSGNHRLLVACSGGGDSVALALLTAEAVKTRRIEATLVHCDHGLREDSAAEADFVRELGARLDLPVNCRKLELPKGGNLEAAARDSRYAALDEIAAETGAGAILTGHTAEDRAETLWLWLLRGTGPAGLKPLPASRPLQANSEVLLLRPLLDLRREELRELLRDRGLIWLEDPSNQSLDLRRNRIRHRLMPFLAEQFDLDPTLGAASLASRMSELLDYLDGQLSALDLNPKAIRHERVALAELPPALARHFMHRLLRIHGEPRADAVERLLEFLAREDSGCSLSLPGGLSARLEARELVLERGEAAEPPAGLPQVPVPPGGRILPRLETGDVPLPGGQRLRFHEVEGAASPPADDLSARFDLDELALPLRLTNPVPGMRIRLLGGPGERKLSDLFKDRKVPQPYRAAWPLLLDDENRLLWAPGLGRSELAPLSPRTRRSLCLDLEPISA